MFNNIGSKIKGLAIVISLGGITLSLVTGIVLYALSDVFFEELGIIAIVIAVLGSVLSWIGSFFAYGFGELIENSAKIAKSGKMATDNRIQKLNELRAQNLITEEEYSKKVEGVYQEQRNGR